MPLTNCKFGVLTVKMSLQNVADEYFSTLNPIASRLYADLQETRGAYEDLWKKLSPEDQDQILTESIIKPEISIKYDVPQSCRSDDYAVKVVVDDHCSYRDEHSGPFTFRTKSQRNLTIFHEERLKVKPQRETVPKAVPKVCNVACLSKLLL